MTRSTERCPPIPRAAMAVVRVLRETHARWGEALAAVPPGGRVALVVGGFLVGLERAISEFEKRREDER